MPTAIEECGDLFVADVMGDLKHGVEEARLDHGEKAFAGPNGVQAAEMLGLPDVAKRLQERRQEQAQAEITPAPKGQKLH